MEWLLAPISALISIIVGIVLFVYVDRSDSGTEKMREISDAIKEGANAFLKTEYKILTYFVIIVAIVLGVAYQSINLGLVYILGAVCSAIAGYFGMNVALRANVRTSSAARFSLNKAFSVAFRGGAVMGLSVVGLALLGVSIIYGLFGLEGDPPLLLGFSFGASAMALFAKAGGGIFTKSADVGADLVGKIEMGIPEDDPRNPAVIADNVGDNVGDVAGTGADLFDSYVASTVAVMILGQSYGSKVLILPLLFSSVGIISSIFGVISVRVGKGGNPGKALNNGTYLTCAIYAVLTFLMSIYLSYDLKYWGATIVGLASGVIIGITSDYYTSIDRNPVKKTAEGAQSGAGITLISGFSYGLISIFPSLLGLGIASTIAYFLTGDAFGVGLSAIGMLSVVGMIIAGDAYGPITDNAKGIAEQSGLDKEVIDITDKLDAAGNTAKAITKGFAIGAAGLTVLSLLATFIEIAHRENVIVDLSLTNPLVLAGTFVGLAVPALFSAMVMLGVGKNAFKIIEEVRRQFREIPGLKEGKEGVKPDYAKCVDIATRGALKELLPASVASISITLAVGFIGGINALGGYLAGCIFSGLLFALLMSNAGGLWDNAKKYIESGAFGGKGSDAHKAAVIGDTLGDPFKDTAGPSLNTLITVISLVASVFASLIIKYSLF